MKKSCVVSCPIATRSGYGSRSRDFVRSLIETKPEWDVKILPQRWGNTPMNALTNDDGDLISRIIPKLEQQPDIWIQITIPNEFQPVGKYNIGVSAVIETTQASADFIDGCNRMDLVLASSEHSKKTLAVSYEKRDKNTQKIVGELKLTKPVEVLFEGFDTEIYDNKLPIHESVSEMMKDVKESFAFLFVGHWLAGDFGHDRKNISTLVHSFINTFKDKKTQPALILKTSIAGPSITSADDIRKKVSMIKQMFIDGGVLESKIPNIYILNGDLTDDEMNSLYNHPKVKAHISFTRGEGFGRPLLEACISGKPIIASNWSGHTDFLNPEFNLLVGGKLEKVHPSASNDWIIQDAEWFTIDYNQACGAMKQVYDNYKQWIEKSRKNRHYVKTNFTKDKMTEKLGGILNQYVNLPDQVQLKLPELKLPKLQKL